MDRLDRLLPSITRCKADVSASTRCRVGKVYEWLGLTVGVVVSATEHSARRPAFEADVTFITAQELCFTFLRDQTVDNEQRIVRPSSVAAPAHGCKQLLGARLSRNNALASCITCWWA